MCELQRKNLNVVSFRVPSWKTNQQLLQLSSKLKELKRNMSEISKRTYLSITPKVEDIKVVYNWINKYGIPHYHVQVFFDKAYGISFERILRLIGDPELEGKEYYIEGDIKNQNKLTIKINAVKELNVLEKVYLPEHYSQMKELDVPFEKSKNQSFYKYEELKAEEKWLKYFKKSYKYRYDNTIKLSTIGRVQRGIATGSNAYFSLNKEMIDKYRLSKEVCMPCVTKSADVKTLIFKESDLMELFDNNKKVCIFDGEKSKTEFDEKYIREGIVQGVDKTFLNSHRIPWYKVENRDSAPIWLCVFGRGKFKIIRNMTNAKSLTTFHGLYIKNKSERYINLLYCYLNSNIGQRILAENKREYGDGLDKFEPNDLNNGIVLDVDKLSDDDKNRVLDIYERINSLNEVDYCGLDEIFRKYLEPDFSQSSHKCKT